MVANHSCECGHELASADAPITVDGRHDAVFENPHGYRYELNFFPEAPGAVASGVATHDDSWFPGYTWQRMFCRRCSRHVGWLFRSKSRVFCGLIVAELDEGAP